MSAKLPDKILFFKFQNLASICSSSVNLWPRVQRTHGDVSQSGLNLWYFYIPLNIIESYTCIKRLLGFYRLTAPRVYHSHRLFWKICTLGTRLYFIAVIDI